MCKSQLLCLPCLIYTEMFMYKTKKLDFAILSQLVFTEVTYLEIVLEVCHNQRLFLLKLFLILLKSAQCILQ